MTDKFSKEKRSEIMSKIRSTDTKIELLVFKELRKRKIYFQKYYNKIIGNPDIAFPRKKKAIFIDGDFWHGNNYEKLKERLPKEYWAEKIEKNVKRDLYNTTKLMEQGWKVLRLWESDIYSNLNNAIEKIIYFLKME